MHMGVLVSPLRALQSEKLSTLMMEKLPKSAFYSINNRSNNEVTSSRLDVFQSWQTSIKIESNNGLLSSKLDWYQVWQVFNWESIRYWALELQARFISSLINAKLRITKIMNSGAPSTVYIKSDKLSITNQSNNQLLSSKLHLYQIW